MDGDRALAVLVGGHLDTVSFVMDYVEFRIGYSILRALRSPRVQLHDGTIAQFPESGSRDALCGLIDTTVVAARGANVDGRKQIEVCTSAGDVVHIDVDGRGEGEFAHLVPADKRGQLQGAEMYIW
jgi:hypothetical protein